MSLDESLVLRQDAANHITASDIIIRENSTFRLVFRPDIIPNHPRNPQAKVGGTFICQRKRPSGEWEDYNELPLTRLRDADWVKLDISSEEMLAFIRAVVPLYGLPVSQIVSGRYTRVSAEELPQLNAVQEFIRQGNNIEDVLAAINLKTVRDLCEILRQNLENDNEAFWHQTFKQHTWVLNQLFNLPGVLLGEKVFVGGKRFNRSGGNEIDFVLQNPVTRNIGIIEIKTPMTPLVGPEYRNNTYSMTADLSGGINQLLVAKIGLQTRYHELLPERTRPINPPCILLAGKAGILSAEQKHNLDMFRNTLSEVTVVTYDELKVKMDALLALITSNNG